MKPLKELLTNSWMTSTNYLAQIGHVLAGYSIVLTTAYFSNDDILWLSGITVILTALVAIKEFIYDANFELPKQTNKDNWMDFGMYSVGMGLGWIGFLIKTFLQ